MHVCLCVRVLFRATGQLVQGSRYLHHRRGGKTGRMKGGDPSKEGRMEVHGVGKECGAGWAEARARAQE